MKNIFQIKNKFLALPLLFLLLITLSSCGKAERDVAVPEIEEPAAAIQKPAEADDGTPFYMKAADNLEAIAEQAQKNKNGGEQSDVEDIPADWPDPEELPNRVDELKDEFKDLNQYPDTVPQIRTFTITAQDYAFLPNIIKVKQNDAVNIIFKNAGGFHSFVLDEFNITSAQISENSSVEVNFIANKKGNFVFYCGIGDHRRQGMVGTLVVE